MQTFHEMSAAVISICKYKIVYTKQFQTNFVCCLNPYIFDILSDVTIPVLKVGAAEQESTW